MGALTINGHIQKLSALLNWAVNEGYIDRNPARGLKVLDKVRRKDKRFPFSTEQLGLIFNAPLYRGCQDDEAGYARPGPNQPRRGRFWVPLIGLHSGMRLNEICQLDVADVRLIEGINCFVITTDGQGNTTDKRLKTENAERLVPIHPTLVEIGFLDYVSARQASGGKLFPELSIACTGYYSDTFSKWFANFLEKDVAYALGGWAGDGPDDGSVTAENYGRGFSIATLARAVGKVTYPSLALDHLIPK